MEYNAIQNLSEEDRSFKSRLLFIKDIFEHKYTTLDILASSIQYKLGISLDQYREDLHVSALCLQYSDALRVLNKANKELKK